MPNWAMRKTHFGRFYTYQEARYEIASNKQYGIYIETMDKILEQFTIAEQIHKRLFVFRFDLGIDNFTADNKLLSQFMGKFIKHIKRKYQTNHIGYLWAREQNESDTQHYHIALILDNRKINNPSALIRKINKYWLHGRVWIPNKDKYKNPCKYFYNLTNKDCQQTKRDIIIRLSYLAKINTKNKNPAYTNGFGTSRLKRPNQTNQTL